MGAHIKKISKYTPSIFQGKFEFASGQGGVSLSRAHPYEYTIMQVLMFAIVVLVLGYLYFISASVLNVIARKEALSHVVTIQSEIGGLEQRYFMLSQEVSPQVGASLGLTPIQNTHYVYRPGNMTSATIARNAI